MPNKTKSNESRGGDFGIEETTIGLSTRNSRNCSKKGLGAYRLVGICFGLLSSLQAALNVSLRLYFHMYIETNTSLSGDNDQLKAAQVRLQANYSELVAERDQLQANFTTLNKERADLLRRLSKLETASAHGWRYFRSSFYLISSERRTWRESRHNCKERDADLVIINSREEQEFVVDFGRETDTIVWIGATDYDKERHWLWVDGTPVISGYWMSNQPDNGFMGEEEDCIALQSTRYNPLKTWDDVSCDLKFHWMCEKIAHI